MVRVIACAIIVASSGLSSLSSASEVGSYVIDQGLSLNDSDLSVELLASGSLWKEAKYEVEGAFRFEKRKEGTYLVVESDFKTKKGPDLKFVLSTMDYTSVKAKTALLGSLIVGELQSFEGEQEFLLPAGTDVLKYKSLLVHCEEKTILWASAPIHAGELIIHGSSWTKKVNKITGHWEIARTQDGLVLRLGSDFKTKNAPDLKFILSPKNVETVNSKNAVDGGQIFGKLTIVKGQSAYLIKDVESLAGYQSLLIYCEEFTKCWGGASLQ